MNTVTLTIDGISVTVPSDYTILEAAKEASINIPTLCYLKDLNKIGACGSVWSRSRAREDCWPPASRRWRTGWSSRPIPPRCAKRAS